jgi:hypothetical protein
MRRMSLVVAALGVCLMGTAWGQGPEVLHGHGHRTRNMPSTPNPPAAAGTNGINYNGGPVLDTVAGSPTTVYYIWYGDWTLDSNANATLTTFAQNIGGSPYFNINTSYYDGSNKNVVNQIAYGGSFTVTKYPSSSSTYLTTLTDSDIQAIVALVNPTDTNGLYFVLTSPDVGESTGFCSRYCGWHTYGSIGGRNIKYSFVGDASTACPSACQWEPSGPNGAGGGDGMTSVVAHELEETVTDPNLNAWYDSSGQENADKCAWTFGTTYTAPNGRLANMVLGGKNYLIQRNWVNAGGGSCALTYTAAPDFSLSASPSPQTLNAKQVGPLSYTVNVGVSSGFTGNVTLSLSGQPAGITLGSPAFSTNPVAAPGSSTLNLNADGTTPPGSYTLTIQGVSGSLTHTTTVTLNIADFTISGSPSSRSVGQGGNTTYTTTVGALNGFTGNVGLTVSGLPAGVTWAFSPPSINGSGGSTLTLTVGAGTVANTYPLTIRGDGTFTVHTATVTLIVTPPAPDFTISAGPASQTVKKGGSTTYTVTLAAKNGFSSNVNLSVSNLPNKASATFSPNPVAGGNGTSTLTVKTGSNGNAGVGTRTLTITGTGGGVTHTTTVGITVTP